VSQPDNLRLLIVDGHHFAYRAFYAIRSMNAPDGFPTNAIYGFIKTLERMRERVKPTHIAVIWDGGLDEERLESLEDYKAERDPMPDDMEIQLDGIVQWLEATGIFTWCQDGVEADDIIGTLAWQAEVDGFTIVIASSDKDFFQLINPNIRVLNPNDKTGTLWGDSQVEAKTGVLPHQIIDWISLMGDSVDGIPGVQGVGPKTAAKLLSEHGNVGAIYEKLNSIASEKLRNRLAEAENDVRRNQKLVGLKKIPQWDESLSDLRPKPRDVAALEGLYRKWNFKSKLEELGEFPF
jgi:DNA polymerase-1